MALALAIKASEFPGCRCWYVANDYALCMAQMRMMKRSPDFMKLVRKCYSQFPPRFELKNGSEIAFRSADRPDLLLGAGLKLICHDEAARSSKDLFWRVLMPMITDTHGTIICGSTYAGRNWFYDLAESGKKWNPDPESPDNFIKTWIQPTSTGYCFHGEQGKADLALLRAQFPTMVWKQEYECEPLATIDAVFMYVDQCIGGEPTGPIAGRQYLVSQDIGRVCDPSGVVVMDRYGNVAHAEQYPLGMKHEYQARRTLELSRKYNNAYVLLDTTGGASGGHHESHIQEYQEIIKSFQAVTWTVDTKRNMINRLALDLEKQLIRIPRQFTDLIAQLKLYRFKMSPSAMFPSFGPSEGKDDLVAALIMASWGRERGWFHNPNGRPISDAFS